jgi:hypothetical protein
LSAVVRDSSEDLSFIRILVNFRFV